jgi:elongation factor Ts
VSYTASAQDVKTLRQRTGAAINACRDALIESEGDFDKAEELLRIRGASQALKKSGTEATEGVVQSYIHAGNKIGVLVQVDCQTDFVARNKKFIDFARELALHIAAAAPLAVSEDEISPEDREREARIAAEQLAHVPEQARERAIAGKLDTWLDDVVLLRQKHVNQDKYGGKTIEELRTALVAETGENIVIRRFSRFAVNG